ncbi:hypothetical protein CDD83_9018 [Cordyceps sp. RAO-2017]|nr:hypothetical protein CDD83_9018 [Cordyceps sp. RAO-2017]
MPDRGPLLLGLVWALAPLAFVILILRVAGRFKSRKCGCDDIFMTLAMSCFLGWSIILTLTVHRGGLQRMQDVAKMGPDGEAAVLFLHWLCLPFGTVGVAAGNISVAALLLSTIKLTELRWQRLFLWAVPIILGAVLAVACSILMFAQCSPTEALWDARIQGECLDPKVVGDFGTFTAAFNAFAAASLAVIPATIFWQLNNSTREKVQLTTVFGLNILTSVCAAIKTGYLVELDNRADQTWATYDIFVWATCEQFLMIVCGSVPTLHVVLGWFRFAASGVRRRKVTFDSSRGTGLEGAQRPGTRPEPDALAHMHVKTETTIETSTCSGTEGLNQAVAEENIPRHGVRVEIMYDVRRDARPISEHQ